MDLKKNVIIIPAYNESSVIGRVIKGLYKELLRAQIEASIVVVDDCSTDNTADVAKKYGATVIKHIINQGAGGATSTGIKYAEMIGADMTITMDADGQHSAEDVVRGIKLMNSGKADLLIGSRLINPKGMSRVKILGNKGLTMITWFLFGVKVSDSQSGLRIFNKKAIDRLEWKSTGYEFCSEMLWRAKQSNLRISEYPIGAIYTEYSKSKGQNNWNAVNIIHALVRRRIMEFLL